MTYETPRLALVGPAAQVVLGTSLGSGDNNAGGIRTEVPLGIQLGLDD